MKWIKLPETEIPVNEGIRRIKVSGKHICLIRHGNKLHATGARCPHAGADLSGGWCEQGRLICPHHRRAFSLDSGKGDPGQGDYITVYALHQRTDGWYIGWKENWWKKRFF